MKTIRWGVLGTAGIFESCTAEGMKQAENCEMYAIAGRSPEKAESFKERFGFSRAYGSYEELIEDPEVEAVYIPLPNTLHHEWTIRALQAGKHVLCEKPVAPSEKEAREMFDAAEENHVLLMEAFAYLHSPVIEAVAQEIQSGTIGPLRYLETAFITSDYDKCNIRMRRETRGGSTYDLGVYCTSFALRMFGCEPDKIRAEAFFSEDRIDLLTSSVLQFPGGAFAKLSSGMVLATGKDSLMSRFQIHGENGSVTGLNFAYNGAGELTYRIRTFSGRDEIKTVRAPQNYRLEVEQFGRCISEGEAPKVSRSFSLANARTVDRILQEIGY